MIVVVGSGVAGLSAALAVAGDASVGTRGAAASGQDRETRDVLVVSKDVLAESNTYHAQGGIAAAIAQDDDPALHAADTMRAGDGLCDETAVGILTREGAERIRELAAVGAHFDRDATGGILQGLEAAHSRPRVVHAGGDATGRVLEKDLVAFALANPRIHVLEHAFLEDLCIREGRVSGLRLRLDLAAASSVDPDDVVRDIRMQAANGREPSIRISAERVILATGGAGQLYSYTTNPSVATADGMAAAWRAGAQVMDLEFYQFHPTALATGEHFLISEAVRGEGAVLVDERGHRYMPDIDARAELAPRDVVARANYRVMLHQQGRPVFLDLSPMARTHHDLGAFLTHRFPTIDSYTRSMGLDWSRDPIPVTPAAHYWMGGIRTDTCGRTSIPGLYAAGECARSGVHGANRLASNSLLEGLVFGRRAGIAAVHDDGGATAAWDDSQRDCETRTLHVPDADPDLLRHRCDMQQEMWRHVGVIRDADGLCMALRRLGAMSDRDLQQACRHRNSDACKLLENRNLVTVGYLIAASAMQRCESRGAHARSDFPQTDAASPLHCYRSAMQEGGAVQCNSKVEALWN